MLSIYLPSNEDTTVSIEIPGRDTPVVCDLFDIDEAVSDAIEIGRDTKERWLTELTNLLNRKWKSSLTKGQVYVIHQMTKNEIDSLKKKSLDASKSSTT